jgi:2-methylisocitrate lyase-like PEP mutase family enzyme
MSSRAEQFLLLHRPGRPLLLPNPWDAGSARLLASAGFAALATTSAGLAHSLGLPDGVNELGRELTLANARSIVQATVLPVSADLESGFADEPEGVADTIRLAASAGLAGASIEDATGDRQAPIRPLEQSVERIAAAAAAARESGLVLTARAENFLYGQADLAGTIDRLQRYAEAGADVLYAPALPDLAAVRAVCASVDQPVNVLATPAFTVAELAAAGVARISLGSGLSRVALGAVRAAAAEFIGNGSFGFLNSALPYASANELMSQGVSNVR